MLQGDDLSKVHVLVEELRAKYEILLTQISTFSRISSSKGAIYYVK